MIAAAGSRDKGAALRIAIAFRAMARGYPFPSWRLINGSILAGMPLILPAGPSISD
jgi:hypothetical protein